MTRRRPAIATRVLPYIDRVTRKLTKGLGISISEYLRGLIIQDLGSRGLFKDELKKAVEEAENTVAKSRKTDLVTLISEMDNEETE